MKKIISLSVFFCLLVCAGPFAGTQVQAKRITTDPIKKTLLRYREKHYELLGPLQYLGETKTHIMLYRHAPIAYKSLKVINKLGGSWFVNKGDFVYVLSKNGRIILISIDKKEGKNE